MERETEEERIKKNRLSVYVCSDIRVGGSEMNLLKKIYD